MESIKFNFKEDVVLGWSGLLYIEGTVGKLSSSARSRFAIFVVKDKWQNTSVHRHEVTE